MFISQQEVIAVVSLTGEAYSMYLGRIKTDKTRETYDNRMKLFLAFHNMKTPDDLTLEPRVAEKKIIHLSNIRSR